ncbi:MAG: ABC transporter substrate-binding protein [Armatimonadota bacterium]
MRASRRDILLLLGALAAGGASAAPIRRRPGLASNRVLRVGGLFPLSGPSGGAGAARRAALEIAAEEINAELDRKKRRLRVRLFFADTQLDPAQALKQLKRLYRQGVRTVVGPFTSAELEVLKPFADARGILLLSADSTASALSIPGDNVLRFCPSDITMGQAIAALLAADGVDVIVPIWRGDSGNDGIVSSVTAAFTALGGEVREGVRYDPGTTDFTAAAAGLAALYEEVEAQEPGRIAVFYSGFDEAIQLFAAVQAHAALAGAAWYGSDGTVHSPALLADEAAAEFAFRSGYPNVSAGLDESARPIWEPLGAAIQAESGEEADFYSFACYDALWVAALAHLEAGVNARAARRREAVISMAGRYFGASGWTRLNEAGDRESGSYDFWAIRPTEGGYQWERVARYTDGHLRRD